MKPGIYHVRFATTFQHDQGDGLVIVSNQQTMNGGDIGYIYRGSFTVSGTKLTARLNIKRWNQYAVSIFGNIAAFDLDIEGHLSSDLTSFSGEGAVVQNPKMRLSLNAQRIEDVV
jgi:hypothetical protein